MQRLNQNDLPQVTEILRYAIATIVEQLDQFQTQLQQIEAELHRVHRHSPVSQLLATTFGVGLITATACAAEYGDTVARFSDSRQFAANLGITPSEHSSGEKHRRGAITRRGNPYLRKLLVQGANTIVNHCHRREDALCRLARRLLDAGKRRTVVIVAIANRLARILYAIIKHRTPYRPQGHAVLTQVA